MSYYEKNNSLYSSDTIIEGEGFTQITEEEYNARRQAACNNRETGSPVIDYLPMF